MFYKDWIVIYLIAGAFLFDYGLGIPKYDGIQKSLPENLPRRSSYYNENKTQNLEQETASTKDRLQRLGYSTGYGSLNGYAGTGLSAYNPIKLDLGGVVLGTLVGIGAIIIIPKLIHAFHGGYAGYGRSEDGDLSAFSGMLYKFDDILAQNNIDSTNCMQRAVCNYVRSTEYNMKIGRPDQMDEFIYKYISENSLVDYLLDGTAIKEALEQGRKIKGKSCEDVYSSCKLDSKAAASILMKLLPKKTEQKSMLN